MTETSPWMTGAELVEARKTRLALSSPEDYATLDTEAKDLVRRYSEYAKRQGVIQDIADVRPRPADTVGVDRDLHPSEPEDQMEASDYDWPLDDDNDHDLDGFNDDRRTHQGRVFWWDREA